MYFLFLFQIYFYSMNLCIYYYFMFILFYKGFKGLLFNAILWGFGCCKFFFLTCICLAVAGAGLTQLFK